MLQFLTSLWAVKDLFDTGMIISTGFWHFWQYLRIKELWYSRGSEFIRLPCPYRTVPYRSVPYRSVPYRSVPYRTVAYRSVPYRSVPYRTVPYRFPRGTVKVDRTAYRTFLTVFRDFYLKARTLPRFKYFRLTVLTQIFRLSANRTVPTHLPFFVILTWSLLEKREPYRDEFLHEK